MDENIELYYSISTTDSNTIKDNALEQGIEIETLDWDQLTKDSIQIEFNILNILNSFGMKNNNEGHDNYDDLVGSVYFNINNLKLCNYADICLDEGINSYDSGLFDYQKITHNLSEIGEKLIDAKLQMHMINNRPDFEEKKELWVTTIEKNASKFRELPLNKQENYSFKNKKNNKNYLKP